MLFTLLAHQGFLLADGGPGNDRAVQYKLISNADNPYDFIGLYHNEGLDAVKNTAGFPCLDPVVRYTHYVKYLQSRYPEIEISYEDMGRTFDESAMLVDLSPDEAVDLFKDRGLISADMSPYLLRIYRALFSHGEAGSTPEQLAEEVKRIENELIDQYRLEFDAPDQESSLALILSGSAIVRYSYAYWYAVDQDAENGWNVILDGGCTNDDPPIQEKGGFWKKLRRAWQDASAFFRSDCDMPFLEEIFCRLGAAGTASSACCP